MEERTETAEVQRAIEWIAKGEPALALEILGAVYERGVRDTALLVEIVLCHLMLGNDTSARRYLKMAEVLERNHSRVLCYRGFLALRDGRVDRSMGYFDESLKADPSNFEAYKWRGLCFRELGDPRRALADLDRAASLMRNDATLLINRGTVYSDLGQAERALDDFMRASALAPNQVHSRFNAGHVMTELGRLDEAKHCYQEAIAVEHACVEAWAGLAAVHSQQGSWNAALRCQATILAIDPENLEANQRAAEMLIESGEAGLGEEHLEVVLCQDPGNPEAIAFRGFAAFVQQRYIDAIEDLGAVLGLFPQWGLPRLFWGVAKARNQGLAFDFLHDLEAAREQTPEHPLILIVSARLEDQCGNHESASSLIRMAIESEPSLLSSCTHHLHLLCSVVGEKWMRERVVKSQNHIPTLREPTCDSVCERMVSVDSHHYGENKEILRARTLVEQRSFQAALGLLDDLLSRDPTCALAYTGRGECYSLLGDDSRAKAEFERAFSLAMDEPQIWAAKARHCHRLGNVEQALTAYKRATELDAPSDVVVGYATLLVEEQMESLALEVLENGYEKDHRSIDALTLKGELLLRNEDYVGALADFSTCCLLDRANPKHWIHRGNAFYELGDLTRAHRDYSFARKLDGGIAEVYLNLGCIALERDELDQSILYFDRALNLDGGCVRATLNRGLALHHKGLLERALVDLQHACSLAPDEADVHFALGRTLASQHKYGAATSAITRALELDPSYVDELEDEAFDDLHKLKEVKRIIALALAQRHLEE